MAIVSKNNAQHYKWGDGCDGWHLAASANLSVIEERVPGGAYEIKHHHVKAEQFFYVLSGEASIEINGTAYLVGPREGIHIPAGAVHQLVNKADEALEFIVISTPPSHGDRVNEI